MAPILVVRDTSHFEISPLKDRAPLNMYSILVVRDTSHSEISALKACASENMECILVVRDTFHFEISQLKDRAPLKIQDMSLTLDTSHAQIGPCSPLGQLPVSEDWRHAETPRLRSFLDCGENAAVRVRVSV